LTNAADSSIIDAGGADIMNITGTNGNKQLFDLVHTLDEKQKIKFFGGKTALFDAGLLNRTDYFKPLKDIDICGILIPDRAVMNHVLIGEYTNPTTDDPNGRLHKGGHAFIAMAEMGRRGIVYNVTSTASNGVVFGNVPRHKNNHRQSGNTQLWFPQSWSEHDIRTAGIISANKGQPTTKYTRAKVAEYKGVKVITWSPDGIRIGTIAPYEEQGE